MHVGSHWMKIWISYMWEICRIGQDFLHFSFVYIKFRPILCHVYVGNVRKCHVLVHRTCSKS